MPTISLAWGLSVFQRHNQEFHCELLHTSEEELRVNKGRKNFRNVKKGRKCKLCCFWTFFLAVDLSTGCFIETQNGLLPRGTCSLRNFLMLIFRSDLHNNYLDMSRVMRIKERTRWPANPEGFSVPFSFYSWHRYHAPVKRILNKTCPTATFLSYLKVTIVSRAESEAGPPSRWCW